MSTNQPFMHATVGEIAKRLGEPLHRVEYLIRARDIQPAGRAGNARVFSDVDVDFIASELARIDSRAHQQV